MGKIRISSPCNPWILLEEWGDRVLGERKTARGRQGGNRRDLGRLEVDILPQHLEDSTLYWYNYSNKIIVHIQLSLIFRIIQVLFVHVFYLLELNTRRMLVIFLKCVYVCMFLSWIRLHKTYCMDFIKFRFDDCSGIA